MPKPKTTEFVPRWARGIDIESFGDMPMTGHAIPSAPRLPIRLLPHDRGSAISARTLSQVVTITQKAMTYASYERIHGPSPEFADLRSVEPEVAQLAKLQIEPFEEGSFIIPTKLSEEDVEIGKHAFSGRQVLETFINSIDAISREDPLAQIMPIGLLQSIEDLGQVIRREADIEFAAFGAFEESLDSKRVLVDKNYISQVAVVKKTRQSTQGRFDTVSGVVTAVNLKRCTFQLDINGDSLRGSFESAICDKMANALGYPVIVEGFVEVSQGTRTNVRAFALQRTDW